MTFDEDSFFEDETRQAALANSSVQDEDPEQAARALELGRVTGVPPTAIYGDVDGFERQSKAALGSAIIGDNFHIADYINSHPMAARVSHDDLGQLDVASGSIGRLAQKSGLEGWLESDSIARSFMKGFGEQELAPEGYERFYKGVGSRPSEMQWALNHPETSSLLAPVTRAVGLGEIGAETLSRITSGFLQLGEDGITKVFGASVAREAKAMAEWLMMKGDIGTGVGEAGAKTAANIERANANAKLLGEMKSALDITDKDPNPSPGVHPIIDDLKKQQAKQDGDALKEALSESAKSATRERSPELYAQFVRSHIGDREIGIDAEAIRKLYGDKLPETDDGILGFIPDLQQKLTAAEGIGGDVQIPLADYLAQVEPEVSKELHDFTRVRDGGLTLDETKGLVDKTAVADPLTLTRAAGGFEPLFAQGDRKLKIELLASGIDEKTGVIGPDEYHILDETGKKVGDIDMTPYEGGKKVYIDNIYGSWTEGTGPNSFGPSLIRDIIRQIKEIYPKAEQLGGFRVTGARKLADAKAEAWVDISKYDERIPEGWDYVGGTRDILHGTWVRSGGAEGLVPSARPPEYDILDRTIRQELERIVPKKLGSVQTVAEIKTVRGTSPKGLYQRFANDLPRIMVSLDDPERAVGIARHEAIHHLRRYGFFNETEWSTLEQASKDHGWSDRYLKGRYEGLGEADRLEESIAEAYRKWKDYELKDAPEGVAAIFEKLKQFFESIKTSFKELTGKDLDWDEIFKKVDKGEIGGREDTKPMAEGGRTPFNEMASEREPSEGPGLFDKAKAMGVTEAHMNRMLSLIEKRNAEDLAKAQARAEKYHKRTMTKEWKERRTEIRDDVRETIEQRPDMATDALLSKGDLKLHPDFLTPSQREMLPKEYIQKARGVPPDDLAPYFGYTSGDALVERLGLLTQDRRRAGMSQRDYLNRLIDVETDRRLNEEFGDLQTKIMEEAKDQAASETQLDLVHEETLAYALAAGVEPKFTKEETRAMVKQVFDVTPVGQIKSDRIIQTAGKLGRKIEDAASKGDWAEAYRISQQRNHATIAAKMARDYERERRQLDRTAKTMGKREVLSIEGEYRSHIQDILTRVGYKTARSVANIQENIGRQAEKTLEQFLQAKLTESMGLRDMPLADVLQDPSFKKPLDQLPYKDFRDVKNTIDGLVTNGRDERKVYREGEAFDRAQTVEEMKDQVRTFPEKKIPSGYEPGLAKQYIAGSTAIPTLMNRFDRNDARGLFHKFVTYPLTRAANGEARLSRETAVAYRKLGDWGDMKKLVDSPLNPDVWRYTTFTRENVLALLQNAGNKSNWKVAAAGWGADPEALMSWLHKNTTKEDWDRAQKMGDTIWNDLVKKADREYERLNGQTIDKIPLELIDTPFGTYKGWYHKLIPDPIWYSEKMKIRGGAYNDADFGHILTSNGYTRARTGAVYPVDLSFSQVPKHIEQMIHDISFRGPLLEVQKILKDPSLQNIITKHYGKAYANLLIPYLEDLAGKQSINGKVWAKIGEASETLRQNTISTYIGGNPFTVAKHAPTAFFMSARDVGPVALAQAYSKLFGQSPEVGKTWWKYALEHSEELQRRERNWQETLGGALSEQYGYPSMRERVMQWGAWPVAMSDKLSAVPLWMARFEKSLAEGSSHGEAVDIADRSVQRQHGSTARTSQPELVRGGGPLHGWLTSVYGFFGTVMQRRIELMHSMNDIYQLGKEREIKAAAARTPGLFMDFLTYVVIPTYIEEKVTGLTTDDRRGWGEHLALASARGIASSFLYLRDLVDAFASGHTPGVGLLSSVAGDLDKTVRDAFKGKAALSRQHAGKTVGDFLTTFGEATGTMPKVVANAARFGIDVANRQANPKGPGDAALGITRGSMKRRVER